ncbi:hypothetical protein CLCR_03408 [Cladophialophora carrionii]|uniref:Uncharacterized protein n=1 Tax=Cladophialophora carrionii TaxID=86049 RepID=A0A1C1CGQ0_9EURO|nr:hypothetical protein CLCR_03408 [Cladophialophora carrionii]
MPRSRDLIRGGEVVWHPEFTRRRRHLNLGDLGKSHLEWRAQSEADTEEEVDKLRDAQMDADIVPLFMRDNDEISAEADKVGAFCPGTTLRRLMAEAAEGGPSSSPKALLHERSIDGGVIGDRRNKGPMTARQLYQALREPRCQSSQAQPSDVRHRHLFLNDLDPCAICALFGTAPHYQRSAVASLVYRHLQPRSCIRVRIHPQGQKFEFEFHLRYKVMRDSDTPNIDTRRFANGTALREYRNVSFLNIRGNQPQTHCYDAQISYLVAGRDESTWDPICVKDAYFDSKPDGTSLTDMYDEISQDADGTVAVDPSTCDEAEPDVPIPDPRQKLVRTMAYQLKGVTAESMRNVDRVYDSVRDYAQSERDRQNPSKKCPSDAQIQAIDTIEWTAKVKELSQMLLMELTDLVHAIDEFLCKYPNLFQTQLCAPSVADINESLEELEGLKKTLENAIARCDSLNETEQNRLKQFPCEMGRKTEFISKSIYPVMIATGIFSMQDHVLPFQANTTAFVCALLIITFLIHLGYDPSWWQLVGGAADSVGLSQQIQAIYLRLPERVRTGSASSTLHPPSTDTPGSSAWTLPWRGTAASVGMDV